MKAKDFFKMLEKANEFKTMIGEQKSRVSIISYGNWGCVETYKDFKKVLSDYFHSESVKNILEGEVQETVCEREFKIDYVFDGFKLYVKLYVE